MAKLCRDLYWWSLQKADGNEGRPQWGGRDTYPILPPLLHYVSLNVCFIVTFWCLLFRECICDSVHSDGAKPQSCGKLPGPQPGCGWPPGRGISYALRGSQWGKQRKFTTPLLLVCTYLHVHFRSILPTLKYKWGIRENFINIYPCCAMKSGL